MARPKAFDETEVLDHAVACFWRRGFEATSVRDLAAEMGIAGPSLYNTFGDKRGLYAQALERYAETSLRERIARLERVGDPKAAIRLFIEEVITRSLKDRERRGCLLINAALEVAPHDAALGAVIAGYLDEIRHFFRRNLLAAQATGQVRADLDAEDTSALLLGVLMGLRVLARAKPDRRLLESVARPALALLDDAQPKTERSPERKRGSR